VGLCISATSICNLCLNYTCGILQVHLMTGLSFQCVVFWLTVTYVSPASSNVERILHSACIYGSDMYVMFLRHI
jgi:hypothetical protein